MVKKTPSGGGRWAEHPSRSRNGLREKCLLSKSPLGNIVNLWTAVSDTRHRTPPVHTLEKSEGSVLLNNTFQSSWVYTVVVLFATAWTIAHRLPCPSLCPLVCSNSCQLSQWCHPTISSSVVPFSSCLQSFPASGSFPMSWLFASCGQSIEVLASASFLSMNIQDWFPLGWTGWISLQFKGLSRVFSSTTTSKASILWLSAFFMVQ